MSPKKLMYVSVGFLTVDISGKMAGSLSFRQSISYNSLNLLQSAKFNPALEKTGLSYMFTFLIQSTFLIQERYLSGK